MSHVKEIISTEAWNLLQNNKNSMLVDVRTQAEWTFVGLPNLIELDKKVLAIEWQIFPDMNLNNEFLDKLKTRIMNKDVPLLFICRSGARSHHAALTASNNGYTDCYNIVDGFEGQLNNHGHRSTINGWKYCALPWEQN